MTFLFLSQICKIGEDAILVELYGVNNPITSYSRANLLGEKSKK